ncbi:MAG TPA: methyltransferase domain-containing protein [Candidatus Acidoferrales bacterium]|nr:methyltransferase domain-containing protein [Candidatus Acidoferrales bacterium]
MTRPATERWALALAEWAIPERIQALAPESPWLLPPEFFKVEESDRQDQRPSLRRARSALGTGGSVLDVGCGGGGASVPLIPQAVQITGVDERSAMLSNFARACAAAEVRHAEVEGRWPDVSAEVEPMDVVVCHHVVYNVAEIGSFLQALTDHSRRLVVVELTDTHPTSPFNPLWQRFWQLPRPAEPSAQLFLEVVRELGYDPIEESFVRPRQPPSMTRSDYVAFARRRLCLTKDRDPEVEAELGDRWPLEVPTIVTVAWEPPPG